MRDLKEEKDRKKVNSALGTSRESLFVSLLSETVRSKKKGRIKRETTGGGEQWSRPDESRHHGAGSCYRAGVLITGA